MTVRLARPAFFHSLFVLAVLMAAISPASVAQVRAAILVGPPALPIYEQPICPGEGYLWTPGYWSYDYDFADYFWVPGTWVMAPQVGYFWTPGYWAWVDNGFLFYDGYWGPQVGFYGGIYYGFGYFGTGYVGGRWNNGRFYYNQSINNVTVNIHNVYNETIVNNNTTINRVSYNGGKGGIALRPTPEEEAAARQPHIPPVHDQTELVKRARSEKQQRASVNQGRPPVAATPRPGKLNERGFVPAREAGAPYTANRLEAGGGNGPRAGSPIHPKELSPIQRPPAPNSGDAARDRQYQQEQDNLFAQQQREREQLQQQQEMEHQRMQQEAEQARQQQMQQERQQEMQNRMQQMEMMHQQQTMEMEQRQSMQWDQMGARQGWRRR